MALSLRSPYADCEYNLGNLYLKTGQMLEAEQRLRNAASLGRTLAWGNLVLLLEEMGRCGHCLTESLLLLSQFCLLPQR